MTKGDLDGEAYAACLRQKLTGDEIQAAVAASLSGDFDAPEVRASERGTVVLREVREAVTSAVPPVLVWPDRAMDAVPQRA